MRRKRPYALILASTLLAGLVGQTPAFAKAKLTSTDQNRKVGPAQAVEEVLREYRRAPGLKAKVKKTVSQETMGTETTSEGDFYYSQGKMRLDLFSNERTTLVYDGKFIWFENRLDDEHVQVTKLRVSQLRKSTSMLASLFEQKDVLKGFKLVSQKSAEGKNVFSFEPKDKKKAEVVLLEIALRDENHEIQRIAYKDQLENRVSFEFTNLNRGSLAADKFQYKPPRGAEVVTQ